MNLPYYTQNNSIGGAPNMGLPQMQNLNNNIPISAPTSNFNFNTQQMVFPQPTGSVYNLSTASDIGNIPAGLSISVGLCLQENLMYIKSLQNGSPVLLAYRLVPLEDSNRVISVDSDYNINDLIKENRRLIEVMKDHDEKIHMLEEQLIKIKDKVGGKTSEWQI